MKKKSTISLFVFLWVFCVATVTYSQTDVSGIWSTAPSTGYTPAYWLSSCTLNDKIYVIGGVDANGNVVSKIQVFDPSTNTWSTLTTTGTFTPRYAMGTTVLDGKIYTLGGSIGQESPQNLSNKLEVFDPSTNTWSTPETTGTFTPRDNLSACTVNGKIYAIGGYNPGTGELNTFEVFDPSTSTWSTPTTTGTLAPWGAGGVVVVNDKIYLVAGNGASSLPTKIQVFDPSTNAWSTLTTTGKFTPRLHMAASLLNGKIYVIGGENASGGFLNTLEVFDPSTNTWSTPKTTGTFAARGFFTSSDAADKIYTIGGADVNGNMANTIGVFTPASADVKANEAALPDIQLSPNPTIGLLTIYNASAGAQIAIENILGETVMDLKSSPTSNTTFDLSKLPAGTYFARIVTPNSTIARKIVRE